MAKKYPNLAKILKRLLFEKDIRAVDLARAVDLPPPTIHRLITGKSTRPYATSLKPIADFFSIDMDQLVGEKPLSSEKEQIKSSCNNEMDKELSAENSKIIPILSWKSFFESTPTASELGKISVGNHIDKHAFALVMPDDSMEPIFSYNCILIFEPTENYKDRAYILVKIEDKILFRQLIDDDDHRYLKPLNPNVVNFPMRLLDKKDKIFAVLVESRNSFKS